MEPRVYLVDPYWLRPPHHHTPQPTPRLPTPTPAALPPQTAQLPAFPVFVASYFEIKIAGRNINNLRYADDTTLMAESEEELKASWWKLKWRVKKLA